MLSITKINEASTSISLEYLGSEHVFGIKVSATYSFSILDAEFVDGTDGLLTGIDALKKAYARKNIAAKIGLDEFKNGLVTDLSLDDSDRVRLGVALISIEENLRPSNDGVLSTLCDNIPSPQDLESFSESLSFKRGADTYSYDRSISLSYKQDAGNQFINKARLFLKNIYLGSRPAYGYQVDGISENGRFNLNLKPKISEYYDEINKELRFTENFESSRIATFGTLPFSQKKTYDIALNEQGYSTKSYSCEIISLSEPLELNILSGIQYSLISLLSENTGAYGMPTTIEKLIKSDDGLATLSVSFSNDPRFNATNNIEYVGRKSQDDSFDKYDFDLKIVSRGANYLIGFNNALTFYSGNRNIGYAKIPVLFPEITSGQMNEVSRNTSFNPFEKSISESVSFSTDPSYRDNGDGILKRSISVSDQYPVGRNEIVPIYGDKELIIRNQIGKTIGSRSVSCDLVSSRSDIELLSLQKASGEIPTNTYKYLTEKTTNYAPLEGTCNANINYQFFD